MLVSHAHLLTSWFVSSQTMLKSVTLNIEKISDEASLAQNMSVLDISRVPPAHRILGGFSLIVQENAKNIKNGFSSEDITSLQTQRR